MRLLCSLFPLSSQPPAFTRFARRDLTAFLTALPRDDSLSLRPAGDKPADVDPVAVKNIAELIAVVAECSITVGRL